MLKKIATGLFIILGVLFILGYSYVQSLSPQYSGEVQLQGLSEEVDIHYDDFGIPHIYATSEIDGYRALGYAHAQDRLWQMEVVRRIAPGRLSELFGTKLLKTDKLFRALSINEYSLKEKAKFEANGNPKVKAAAQAYLDGVNAYIQQGSTPIEYTVLGIKPEPFTMLDVYNTMGYMAFSFAAAPKTEPIVTQIMTELGEAFANDLAVDVQMDGTLLPTYSKLDSVDLLAVAVDDIMSHLPAAPFIGSNSWVIGGSKTKSGKVILANDPHIAYSQPAVWYEAHIETPEFSYYGYYLAGYPFAIIGHNRDFATGLTMFENDDIDMFFETENPDVANQYQHKGVWKDYAVRKEVIKVKDSLDVIMMIKTGVHGPVMNQGLGMDESMPPVSLFWVFTQKEANIIETTYNFSHLNGMKSARDVSETLHAPGLNIMYGDAAGNYARWSSAHLLQRPAHVNPKIILEGASGDNDPLGYYDFSYNTKTENAPWGYSYSANNQADTTHGVAYPGYYVPEDRAKRITRKLEGSDQWDVASTKQMMIDIGSDNSPEVAALILEALDSKLMASGNEEEAINILKGWDGEYTLDAVAPTIYNKMLYKINERIMKERLGEKSFKTYLKTHLLKRSIQPLFANDSSVWWDDPSTKEVETRSNIMTTAWVAGLQELEAQLGKDINTWTWDRVHTLEHKHVFGSISALRPYFNVGPFSAPGGNEVINNYLFTLNAEGEYEVHAGPSTRRIVDFANVESNSWSILPTGNSGRVFSPHYNDQADMYIKGEFRRQLMNKDEIIKQSQGALVLTPD